MINFVFTTFNQSNNTKYKSQIMVSVPRLTNYGIMLTQNSGIKLYKTE